MREAFWLAMCWITWPLYRYDIAPTIYGRLTGYYARTLLRNAQRRKSKVTTPGHSR